MRSFGLKASGCSMWSIRFYCFIYIHSTTNEESPALLNCIQHKLNYGIITKKSIRGQVMLIKFFIKPRKGVLDPQGRAVAESLKSLGFDNVKDVKVGKYIEVYVDSTDKEKAIEEAKEMAKKAIVNDLIEDYEIQVVE
jgi:phosphoribosylformylglycinamidine synthase